MNDDIQTRLRMSISCYRVCGGDGGSHEGLWTVRDNHTGMELPDAADQLAGGYADNGIAEI